MSKTIAAIATALGEASIGVVRISGDDAIIVADKVFRSVSGKTLAECQGYSALFGHVEADGEKIDEAVALVFLAPKSYTGENVVELSVHGGSFVVRQVLRAVLDAGAIMAERGEFTKRAFENGKMSLNEAESVMDIISADGEQHLSRLLANFAITKQRGYTLCGRRTPIAYFHNTPPFLYTPTNAKRPVLLIIARRGVLVKYLFIFI